MDFPMMSPEQLERAIANHERHRDQACRGFAAACVALDWSHVEIFASMAFDIQADINRLQKIRM